MLSVIDWASRLPNSHSELYIFLSHININYTLILYLSLSSYNYTISCVLECQQKTLDRQTERKKERKKGEQGFDPGRNDRQPIEALGTLHTY